MLLELNIANIALIESLRVEFAPGLNVLTGETGAGKSILIDSVNLSLGGRADRDLIRSGAERASVQAVFDVRGDEAIERALSEMGIEAEDGYLTIGRELSASGRNLCRASGMVVPLNQLKALAALLVEMHGQHEHQELLSSARHLQWLDDYGDQAHQARLQEVRAAFTEYDRLRLEHEALARELNDRERMIAVYSMQLEQIDQVKPKKGEDEKLEKRFRTMDNAEKLSSSLETASRLVYQGGERAPSAQEALKRAASALDAIAPLDERYAEAGRRLNELFYQTQDLGYELSAMLEELEFDPDQLDKIGARLSALDQLKNKFGPTLDEVLAFREKTAAQLEMLSQGDERLDELRKQRDQKRKALVQASAQLTGSRRALGEDLSARIMETLAELGMPKSRVCVQLTPIEPGRTGADNAEFMISLNAGEPLKRLSETASGGELSRIMLALKTIMADRNRVGTMIFDEIDTGISGRTAQIVGAKMAALGAARQVIAVSHLPQIAAMADAHYLVEKNERDGRVGSDVRPLDEQGRIDELARMVSGAGDEQSSRAHAANMRAAAEAVKGRKND